MTETKGGPSGHWWRAEDVIIDVYARQLGASATLVYLCLCRHANAQGQCWPSAAYIATKLAMSPTTVYTALKRLTDAKLIVRQRRTNYMGFKTSCLYTLLPIVTPPVAPDSADDPLTANGSPQRDEPLPHVEATDDPLTANGSPHADTPWAASDSAVHQPLSNGFSPTGDKVALIEVASREPDPLEEDPPAAGVGVGPLVSREGQIKGLQSRTVHDVTRALAVVAVLDRAGRAAEVDQVIDRAHRLGLGVPWLTHRLTKLAEPSFERTPRASPAATCQQLAQLEDAIHTLKPRRSG